MAGHEPVVARDDLHFDMQLREVAQHARGVSLGRIEEEQEAREDHLRLVVTLVGSLGRDGTRREPKHAEARLAFRLVVRRELGGDDVRQARTGRRAPPACNESTFENAPFVTTRCRSASPPSAITIVRHFLRKS